MMQTEFNMTEAAILAGVSRRTFYNHIESKPITTKRNHSDEKVVDLSELKRIYGEEIILTNLQKMQKQGGVQQRESAQTSSTDSVQGVQTMDARILQAKIDALENEKSLIKEQAEREREQIRDERDFLRKALEDSQESQKRITLLLEDQREGRGDEWKSSIRALEQRLANQEKAAKEREEKEQKLLDENKRIKQAYMKQKQALEAEQNKSIWKKLFG